MNWSHHIFCFADFHTDAAEVGYNALFGDIVVDAVE